MLPLLLPLALIASSAIMVAPYANEEIKKQQEAKEVIDIPANDMVERQSIRLQGTDSLLMANPDDPTTSTKTITQQSWFIPLAFAGVAFFAFVVLRK
jgi:hypothetical protein